jgi:hypothetical protein
LSIAIFAFFAMITETYGSEDAQQILQLAIARHEDAGELTRAQLFEIAAELNISAADLQAAEQEWLARRGEVTERRAFDRFRQDKFRKRLGNYVIVNMFLMLINLLISPGHLWALFILLAWGMSVALNAWRTYHLSGEEYEEAFQRWQQKRQLRKSVIGLLDRWLGVG